MKLLLLLPCSPMAYYPQILPGGAVGRGTGARCPSPVLQWALQSIGPPSSPPRGGGLTCSPAPAPPEDATWLSAAAAVDMLWCRAFVRNTMQIPPHRLLGTCTQKPPGCAQVLRLRCGPPPVPQVQIGLPLPRKLRTPRGTGRFQNSPQKVYQVRGLVLVKLVKCPNCAMAERTSRRRREAATSLPYGGPGPW